MSNVTMIGCDLHDCWTLLKVAGGGEKPIKKSFLTYDVDNLIDWLQQFARQRNAPRI